MKILNATLCFALVLLCVLPVPYMAAQGSAQVIQLWPEGVPGAKPNAGEERNTDARISNVQAPSLTYFPAPPAIAVGNAKGPHGFALAEGLGPTSEWPKRFEEWMRSHGWLEKTSR